MSKIWAMVSYVLFIIGLVLSVVGGLFLPEVPWVVLLLAIFGLVIGLIHMKAKEINTLLLATIALLAMTAAFAPVTTLGLGKILGSILVYFAALIAPVAVIAAIRALIKVGLEK